MQLYSVYVYTIIKCYPATMLGTVYNINIYGIYQFDHDMKFGSIQYNGSLSTVRDPGSVAVRTTRDDLELRLRASARRSYHHITGTRYTSRNSAQPPIIARPPEAVQAIYSRRARPMDRRIRQY
jgi:hypothetical protein